MHTLCCVCVYVSVEWYSLATTANPQNSLNIGFMAMIVLLSTRLQQLDDGQMHPNASAPQRHTHKLVPTHTQSEGALKHTHTLVGPNWTLWAQLRTESFTRGTENIWNTS